MQSYILVVGATGVPTSKIGKNDSQSYHEK
jgi:hypothetical protein